MKNIKAYPFSPYSLVAFASVILIAGIFLPSFTEGKGVLERYANGILKDCSSAKYRPSCYEEKISKLMEKISMEEAFQVTAIVQQKDPSYAYCHVLGHKLSAAETAKDPSRWESIIPRCPPGVCSNGCIHGAFQERFRKESFDAEEIDQYKEVFGRICEAKENWKPTGMEQATCYHALGHLLMYVTRADIDGAIDLCREVAIKDGGRRDMSQLCFDGAFMQIFQPLEPDDFALIEGKEVKKENADAFCGRFTGVVRGSCRSESWPLFRKEFNNPENVVRFCEYLANPALESRCLSSLIYVLTAQAGLDAKVMQNFCADMPEAKRGICFANVASRMLENDYRGISDAVKFCGDVSLSDSRGECYKELVQYSTFNFHENSPQFNQLCNLLPSTWKEGCFSRNQPQ